MAVPETVAVTLNSLMQRVHLLFVNSISFFKVTTACLVPFYPWDVVIQETVLVTPCGADVLGPLGAEVRRAGRKTRCAWGSLADVQACAGHSVCGRRAGL